MASVCSWCDVFLRPGCREAGVSHAVCRSCLDELRRSLSDARVAGSEIGTPLRPN